MPKQVGADRLHRSPRFETFEPRLVMSADPLGQIHIDYLIEDEHQPQQIEQQGTLESLESVHGRTGLTNVRNDYGFEGAGQTVAVIDSGIAWDHFALGGGLGANYRVVGGWDFAENDANPYDDGLAGSHGTHVAGIIGADGGANTGVAPGVDLVALRVFNDAGDGYFSWVEKALQWVHTNRNKFENPITTVNLSLGTDWNASNTPNWAMLEDEFAQLEADGIFISVAAGNSFASFNKPGLSYPAASNYVVPVSSVDANGAFSYFSQRHDRAIAAPGRYISSTVPDYVGNQNGVADDFSSYSGTSMAAPYVAGASVLIREAMQFAGYSNITQDSIYAVMRNTADTFWDSATSASYKRLNLQRAIDSVMPDDDYGSTVETAHNLGSLGQNGVSLDGTVGKLSDLDYFQFTATATGSVTFTLDTTHGMTPRWMQTGGLVSGDGLTLTLNVVAGKSYTVGVGADDAIGHYSLDVAMTASEADVPHINWGVVDQVFFANQSNSGNTWYRVQAARTGYFTIEALFSHAEGNLDLEVYDRSGENLLRRSNSSTSNERIDLRATAGDVYYFKVSGDNNDVDLRVTNLLVESGSSIVVHGTSGADTYKISTGAFHNVCVNDTYYHVNGARFQNLSIQGGGGADTAIVTLSAANERIGLRPHSLLVTGGGYHLTTQQIETIDVRGNRGDDEAFFHDSAGDDIFTAHPTAARMTGGGFDNQVRGVGVIRAYRSGGVDLAHLFDSAGDDRFTSTSTQATLSGAGFTNTVYNFNDVRGYASAGVDQAIFQDSAGNDVFVGSSQYATMSGTGYLNQAEGFDHYTAHASSGVDQAYLYDSAGDDEFNGRGANASMASQGYAVNVAGFDRIDALAVYGGADVAYLWASAANDTFYSDNSHATLQGKGYFIFAQGFDGVGAPASGGYDIAYFYDTPGNEGFTSRFHSAETRTTGSLNRDPGFDKVHGQAADDRLTVRTAYAAIQGSDFYAIARGFDRTYAHSNVADPADITAVDYLFSHVGAWK